MSKQSRGVGRRRSRSLVEFASKDLCETIPQSLTSSEALLVLLEKSFQFVLSNIQKEGMLTDDFDIDIVRQKGTKCSEKMKSVIEEKNLHELAVSDNGILSQSFTNDYKEECKEALTVFQTESDKWDNQILSYRERLTKKINSPYVIDATELKVMEQFDYSDVMKSTLSIQEMLSHKVATLSSSKAVFRDCLQINKTFHSSLLRRCEKYFQQNVSDSPRTLIKNITATKKYIGP